MHPDDPGGAGSAPRVLQSLPFSTFIVFVFCFFCFLFRCSLSHPTLGRASIPSASMCERQSGASRPVSTPARQGSRTGGRGSPREQMGKGIPSYSHHFGRPLPLQTVRCFFLGPPADQARCLGLVDCRPGGRRGVPNGSRWSWRREKIEKDGHVCCCTSTALALRQPSISFEWGSGRAKDAVGRAKEAREKKKKKTHAHQQAAQERRRHARAVGVYPAVELNCSCVTVCAGSPV